MSAGPYALTADGNDLIGDLIQIQTSALDAAKARGIDGFWYEGYTSNNKLVQLNAPTLEGGDWQFTGTYEGAATAFTYDGLNSTGGYNLIQGGGPRTATVDEVVVTALPKEQKPNWFKEHIADPFWAAMQRGGEDYVANQQFNASMNRKAAAEVAKPIGAALDWYGGQATDRNYRPLIMGDVSGPPIISPYMLEGGVTNGEVYIDPPLAALALPKLLRAGAPAEKVVAGAPRVAGTAIAETVVSREGIVSALGEAIQPQLSSILKHDPDALVGFRGSLASGSKGPHKAGVPFDPSDFDIDAFIVSDKLAAQFPSKQFFRSGSDIDGIAQAQSAIETSLRGNSMFSGMRAEPLEFRIFTQSEMAKIQAKEASQYFFLKPR